MPLVYTDVTCGSAFVRPTASTPGADRRAGRQPCVVKREAPIRFEIPRVRQRDIDGQNMTRVVADIDGQCGHEASDEEACSAQEHNGERHLHDDEAGPEAPLIARLRNRAMRAKAIDERSPRENQRRNQAGEAGGGRRQHECEPRGAGIDRRFFQARQRAGRNRPDQTEGQGRQQQSRSSRGNREDCSVDEQMARERRSRGAKCDPDRKLTPPVQALREDGRGKVQAGDQQHGTGGIQEQPQRIARPANDDVLERQELDAISLRGLFVLSLETLRELVHLALGLRERGRSPQASHHVIAVRRAAAEIRVPFHRRPDVGGVRPDHAVAEIAEVPRQDAHDRETVATHGDGETVERPRGEFVPPEVVTDDRYSRPAGPVLLVGEQPADRWTNAECLEETTGSARDRHSQRMAIQEDRFDGRHVRNPDAVEHPCVLPPVGRVREGRPPSPAVRADLVDPAGARVQSVAAAAIADHV